MTSDGKKSSNRANARLGTGPKTAAGKAGASKKRPPPRAQHLSA